MIICRTALPATPLAGSIAAVQLREHGWRNGWAPTVESLLLTHLVVDRAVAMGSVRPELRIALSDRLRVEIWDEGRGVTRIAAAREGHALRALLDTQTMDWGHRRDAPSQAAVLWFDARDGQGQSEANWTTQKQYRNRT